MYAGTRVRGMQGQCHLYSNILSRRVLHRIVQVGWSSPSGGYCAPPIRGHTSRDTAAAICIRQRRALRIDVKICSKISLGNSGSLSLSLYLSFVVSLGAIDVYTRIIARRTAVRYNLKNVSSSRRPLFPPPSPGVPDNSTRRFSSRPIVQFFRMWSTIALLFSVVIV